MKIFEGKTRKDGKRKCTLVFSNGVHLIKIYAPEEIEQLRKAQQLHEHTQPRLSCHTQKGTLPLGSTYRTRPQWYIKFEGSPCAMGPWTAKAIRKHFTA